MVVGDWRAGNCRTEQRASGKINLLNEQNQPITIGIVIGWKFFFDRSLKFWE